MNRVSVYLIIILIILLGSETYQISIYREWYPKMIWAADTLRLNVEINRENWLTCKKNQVPM